MTTQIQAALSKLDVNNDNHWTGDGLPRVETVRMLASDQSLTREAITLAAPEFTRLAAYNAQQAALAPPATAPAPTAETTLQAPPVQAAAVIPPQAPPAYDPAVAPAALTEALELIKDLPDVSDLSDAELLALHQDEILEIDKVLHVLKKQREELSTLADALIIKMDKETPKHSNQQDIMAYLASQNKLLERRAQQISNVKKIEGEMGAKLADLVPKRSPIDTVMARKTGYGRKRPGT
jgi:hypothetical protein